VMAFASLVAMLISRTSANDRLDRRSSARSAAAL